MPSRRDFFRVAGASGASFMFAHALSGCSDSMALPEDPSGRWWLSGNYAPVPDELEAFDLEVEGALPPELDGLFVRNGANPVTDSLHWFTGDGMLHGLRLSGGRALWYRNRFIDTLARRSTMPDALASNRGNTSIKSHAGKLLALYEAGVPHEISADDLSTVGEYDFAGELRRPMSAHPKFDPATGEMFFIGYAPFPPYLTYHRVDASGALVANVEVDIDHASMMHDFQLTASHALLLDLPVHFDTALLAEGFPFRWAEEAPARIGVLPRDGSSATVQWFEIDPCYMFHTFNAYETESGITLEGCRLPDLWRESIADASETPTPWRWDLDLSANTVSESQLFEGSADFPQIDPRKAGQANRIMYSLQFRDESDTAIARPNGIRRYDRMTGMTRIWQAGEHQPDEALFVPFGEGEDEGYLLSMVFDPTTARSYVAVLDATRVEAGPVARVHMPRRVPFGFHGTWLQEG